MNTYDAGYAAGKRFAERCEIDALARIGFFAERGRPQEWGISQAARIAFLINSRCRDGEEKLLEQTIRKFWPATVPLDDPAYAAGFCEGALEGQRIRRQRQTIPA
jgi:hypothetical protein